jgi:16S rRNA (adenine1518-N6/adenine1519-N6)-dimethyltransferase
MPDQVTPAVARDVLRRHGLQTKRSLGQHFLVDPNTARRIVRIAGVRSDETILEIGPGLGSLTVALAAAARRVVAVEIDARVAGALSEVVDAADNVEIVVADAMDADLGALAAPESRLVANLPYNLATPILMRVLDDVPGVRGGVVMVQREVGERWVAAPGSGAYGSTSVHVQLLADAKIEGEVPSTVFMPRPKVSSVLVSFVRREGPLVATGDPRGFIRFVRGAFGHRRKTVRNALIASGWDAQIVERALADAGVEPRTRPEQIDIGRFARIFEAARAAA